MYKPSRILAHQKSLTKVYKLRAYSRRFTVWQEVKVGNFNPSVFRVQKALKKIQLPSPEKSKFSLCFQVVAPLPTKLSSCLIYRHLLVRFVHDTELKEFGIFQYYIIIQYSSGHFFQSLSTVLQLLLSRVGYNASQFGYTKCACVVCLTNIFHS